ncbi:MAG: hypothetical protein HRU70_14710 [Phycisphaeraceae bacterium]|nr:MAG: hypothetical protein HRU70_14710 [Phycisphaeraceae bacterium]
MKLTALATLTLFTASVPHSLARDDTTPATTPDDAPPRLSAEVTFGGVHRFRADIDDGGRVAVSSAAADLKLNYRATDRVFLAAGLRYGFSEYDFSGSTGFGGLDPWDQIHTARLNLTAVYRADEHWSYFAGPSAAFSGESDADFEDGLTFGGAAGATYTWDERTFLGFGLIVTSQIEEDLAVFPIVRFSLPLSESVTLRSAALELGAAGGAGAEIAWKPDDQWTLAAGAQWLTSRFRLDPTGPQPDGVGEDRGIPVFLRASWTPSRRASVTLFGGVLVGGTLRLDDSDGNEFAVQDVDPAPFIGAAVDLRY